MTMTPGPATRASLNAQVAAEVRAEMGRRGMSNAELARLLGVSEAWTTRRLGKRADTTLNLVDLQRIAAALRVPHAVFLTPEIRDIVPEAIPRLLQETVRPAVSASRSGNRPPGHPSGSRGPGGSRTAYVERAKRGKEA